jgi:hypothetical protein
MRKKLMELIAESAIKGDYTYIPDVVDHLLANGVTINEWISVDERLPESGVHCILCCDMKRIDGTHSQYVCDGYFVERWKIIAHYVDDDCATEYNEIEDEYYLKEGWYEVIKNWDDYNSIVIDDTVTHWMPLPEPPKKGGGE